MEQLKPKSMLFLPAVREGQEIIKTESPVSSFPARAKALAGEGVLGMVVINGSTAGALVREVNVQQVNKGQVIYAVYKADGRTELDAESVEAAIAAYNAKQDTIKRRTVTMTDGDQQYLTKLGGGNVSAGIRVAVEVTRTFRGWKDRREFD